ncbi:MAG: hypothetical protein DDT33_01447 [Firmicutes bacterium]|nr:hypothetical protein [Bacillota bacterium]
MVSDLIEKRYGIKLSVVSVGRLLKKLGISCQKPLNVAQLVKEFCIGAVRTLPLNISKKSFSEDTSISSCSSTEMLIISSEDFPSAVLPLESKALICR